MSRLERAIMDDKIVHTIQLALVLATAILLIIFASKVIDPLAVFTSMIAGIGGIVGTRIASNGYSTNKHGSETPTAVTAPTVTINNTTPGGNNGKEE